MFESIRTPAGGVRGRGSSRATTYTHIRRLDMPPPPPRPAAKSHDRFLFIYFFFFSVGGGGLEGTRTHRCEGQGGRRMHEAPSRSERRRRPFSTTTHSCWVLFRCVHFAEEFPVVLFFVGEKKIQVFCIINHAGNRPKNKNKKSRQKTEKSCRLPRS